MPIATTPRRPPTSGPTLSVWHLRVPAAPHPLIIRSDRPVGLPEEAAGVADVVRYVAVARQTLRGPLALEIEGPGDPMSSPETVLRTLALLHEHHPDVLTGLVFDGPLLGEYAEDFADFALRYLVLRMDAASPRSAKRLVERAVHRGDRLDRDEAARLLLESGPQALRIAARVGIPTMVRLTLLPTVNGCEVRAIAERAREAGAVRMEVVPHAPWAGTRLARAGVPTPGEMAEARSEVEAVFGVRAAHGVRESVLDWLAPDRLQPVDLDLLEAADVLRGPPAPRAELPPAPVLPPRRTQLVAVATRDGALVDTPLSGAHLLRIYAVTDRMIRLLGSRPLALDPRRRQDGVGDAQDFLAAIVGCRALVATQITARAATLLGAVGIRAVACGGPVEEVLDRVARGTVVHAGTDG